MKTWKQVKDKELPVEYKDFYFTTAKEVNRESGCLVAIDGYLTMEPKFSLDQKQLPTLPNF